MKICGIVAEYNPFHNGHKYHIEKTKELYGATHIAVIMSGNFTQRGEPALFDKYRRAQTALKNGADLVIELPVAYALGSAEQFAYGAVSLLKDLGCVEMISFGSECGDVSLLEETAGAVMFAQQNEDFFRYMKQGDSYPTALQKTIETYYEEDIIDALTAPNNTLAVEYLKALGEFGSDIKPVTIKRVGTEHDSGRTSGYYASAAHIRRSLLAGEDMSAFVPELPEEYAENMAKLANLETAILAKLRTMTKEELEKAPNVLMGLENRIYKAVRVSTSLAELYALIKTKRYTMSRIRRIVMAEFIGIRKSDLKTPPPYVRILGMNAKGREILSAAECPLPVNTSLKALADENAKTRRFAALEERAGDLYALAFDKKRVCGLDYTAKPVIN
ncbi:MAG: nucleotidyltransferase [Ruminiclostridium sp.]|nr:nucleotidyltransferase [Ruminiclostridium sp.]